MRLENSEQPERDWMPTRTSTRIAGLTTLGTVGLLIWHVDQVLLPVLLGVVGAGLFTLSCWLSSLEDHAIGTAVVSLLAVPVALGLLASPTLMVLMLTEQLFPVPDASLVSVTTLVVAGHTGVVLGCTTALLGFSLGYWHVLDRETITRYWKITFVTGFVPSIAVLVLFINNAVFETGPLTLLGTAVSVGMRWLIAPDPRGLNLAGFLFVVVLTLASVRIALRVLPLSELLGDTGSGDTTEARIAEVRAQLRGWIAAVGGLAFLAFLFELLASTESLLGSGVYGIVQAVSTAPPVRGLFVLVTVLSLCSALLAVLVRWVGRRATDRVTESVGPILGGTVITVVAITVADPVYTGTVDFIASPIPEPISTQIYDITGTLAETYGKSAIVMLLAVGLLVVTLWFLITLWLGLFLGYLSSETAGYSLATLGLFLGSVSAGTIGAPIWLLFGGIVCSLLVWDSGRFGTTLGKEIGQDAETRHVELVHAGATLAVGLCGALIATGLSNVVSGSVVELSSTTPLALLAIVVGILSLIAALR